MTQLCHNLFSNRNYAFIFESIMKVYKRLLPSLQTRVNNLVELISDIKDPAPAGSTQPLASTTLNAMDTSQVSLEVEQQQQQQPQMSAREITIKITNLKLTDDSEDFYKKTKQADKQVEKNNNGSEPVHSIEIVIHCLQISICLLQDMEMKQLTPQLRSLCDSLVV